MIRYAGRIFSGSDLLTLEKTKLECNFLITKWEISKQKQNTKAMPRKIH